MITYGLAWIIVLLMAPLELSSLKQHCAEISGEKLEVKSDETITISTDIPRIWVNKTLKDEFVSTYKGCLIRRDSLFGGIPWTSTAARFEFKSVIDIDGHVDFYGQNSLSFVSLKDKVNIKKPIRLPVDGKRAKNYMSMRFLGGYAPSQVLMDMVGYGGPGKGKSNGSLYGYTTGAGHGGHGGRLSMDVQGDPYGTSDVCTYIGGSLGGSSGSTPTFSGAAIELMSAIEISIDGHINVDAQYVSSLLGKSGGSSGGRIRLWTKKLIVTNKGLLSARGSPGMGVNSGGGGGGVIQIIAEEGEIEGSTIQLQAGSSNGSVGDAADGYFFILGRTGVISTEKVSWNNPLGYYEENCTDLPLESSSSQMSTLQISPSPASSSLSSLSSSSSQMSLSPALSSSSLSSSSLSQMSPSPAPSSLSSLSSSSLSQISPSPASSSLSSLSSSLSQMSPSPASSSLSSLSSSSSQISPSPASSSLSSLSSSSLSQMSPSPAPSSLSFLSSLSSLSSSSLSQISPSPASSSLSSLSSSLSQMSPSPASSSLSSLSSSSSQMSLSPASSSLSSLSSSSLSQMSPSPAPSSLSSSLLPSSPSSSFSNSSTMATSPESSATTTLSPWLVPSQPQGSSPSSSPNSPSVPQSSVALSQYPSSGVNYFQRTQRIYQLLNDVKLMKEMNSTTKREKIGILLEKFENLTSSKWLTVEEMQSSTTVILYFNKILLKMAASKEDVNFVETFVTSLLHSIENLLQSKVENKQDNKEYKYERLIIAVEGTTCVVMETMDHLNESYFFKTNSIEIYGMAQIDTQNTVNIPPLKANQGPQFASTSRVAMPMFSITPREALKECKNKSCNGKLLVAFTVIKNTALTRSQTLTKNSNLSTGVGKAEVNSEVLTILMTYNSRSVNNLNQEALLRFTHQIPRGTDAKCSYLNYTSSNGSGTWVRDGLTEMTTNSEHTVCSTIHLTSFAVLMQFNDYKLPAIHDKVIHFITYIGSAISLAGLLLSIFAYIALDGLLQAMRYKIHLNLSIALGLAQIVFLAGISSTKYPILCAFIAFALHYLFLAAFSWMAIEGLHLYFKIVTVFNSEGIKLKYYMIFGWGFPIFLVLISAATNHGGYGKGQTCWLSIENGLRWSYIGPIVAMIGFNCIILVLTLRELLKLKKSVVGGENRVNFKAVIILLPLLGVTWFFGLLGFNSYTIVFQYIFAIFTSLQGLFIFLFHCIGNSEVRHALKRLRIRHSSKITSVLNGSGIKQPKSYNDCENEG